LKSKTKRFCFVLLGTPSRRTRITRKRSKSPEHRHDIVAAQRSEQKENITNKCNLKKKSRRKLSALWGDSHGQIDENETTVSSDYRE